MHEVLYVFVYVFIYFVIEIFSAYYQSYVCMYSGFRQRCCMPQSSPPPPSQPHYFIVYCCYYYYNVILCKCDMGTLKRKYTKNKNYFHKTVEAIFDYVVKCIPLMK